LPATKEMSKVSTELRFGDFVKEKRKKREITLKTLSKKLDLSIAYWIDIENNRRYPINDKIEMLIKRFINQ
jgi:transcriptional regulator with XRE-family HTH domain